MNVFFVNKVNFLYNIGFFFKYYIALCYVQCYFFINKKLIKKKMNVIYKTKIVNQIIIYSFN